MNLDVIAVASGVAIAGDSTPGEAGYYTGGVGRNIAEGLSRLGVTTRLVSAIGADDAGRQLLADCQRCGIITDHIHRLPEFGTSSYIAINNHRGELLHAVSDMTIIDELTLEKCAGLAALVGDAETCVIDCNLPVECIAGIASTVAGCLVADAVSSIKCMRLKNILPSISLLKVNQLEAATLTDSSEHETPQVLIYKLIQAGVESVLMSLGSDGAVLADSAGVTHTLAAPTVDKILSVNGAGDALLAGVVSAALYGKSEFEALRWGTTAAALSLGSHKACPENLSLNAMALNTVANT